jgi:ABC-type transporter Mla subunit MlaD
MSNPEREDDYKYAELPGGKLLKFPPKTTDKDIARAVRKELGITSQGELVMMETIDDLLEGIGAQNKVHREQIDQVSDTLNANGSRISAELSDAVRDVREAVRSMDENMRKVMSSQNLLVSNLKVVAEQLNSTMDHALGESLGTMSDSNRVAGGIENSIRDMNVLVGGLMRVVKEVSDLKKIRRKAYRQRDGSYTFETDFD